MTLLVASRLPLEKDSSCVLQELKKVRRHLFDTFGVGLTGSLGIQAPQRSLNILQDILCKIYSLIHILDILCDCMLKAEESEANLTLEESNR